jgi:hypothetical protein
MTATILVLLLNAAHTLSAPDAKVRAFQQRDVPCSQTVFNHDHESFIPPGVAWEHFFDEAAASGFVNIRQQTSAPAKQTEAIARIIQARSNAALVRAAYRSKGDRPSAIQLSDVVLDARDDLIRLLPADVYATIEHSVGTASSLSFTTPALGTVSEGHCVVAVRGSEYPELIPEYSYWRLYFYSRANGAAKHRIGDDYEEGHLRAVHSEVPIPLDYIRRLLNVSANVVALLEATPETTLTAGIQQQLVFDARAELIRTMPEIVWLQVKKDAVRARSGMIVVFPSDR